MLLSKNNPTEALLNPLKIGVLRQLETGGILTERRLAQYIGVSHVTAHNILNQLAHQNLATSQRVGRANLWSINRKSYGYRAVRLLLEALEKFDNPLQALEKLLREALSNADIKEIILFGSLTNGTEREESDIDVCLIVSSHRKKGELENVIETAVDKCYLLFGKRLSTHVFSEKEWRQKKETPLGISIQKGKRIFL